MPRSSAVIIVKNMVGSIMPPAKESSAEASFRPTPVFVTTPIMMPAEAQATSTPRTAFAPFSSPMTTSMGRMRVDFRRLDAKIESTMANSAARIGV